MSPGHDKHVGYKFFLELGYEPTFLRVRVVPGTRESLARTVRAWQEQVTGRPDLESKYVCDFYALPARRSDDPEAGERFICLLRRLSAEENPDVVRQEFDRRLEQLQRSGELPVVDMQPQSGIAGGLPEWLAERSP